MCCSNFLVTDLELRVKYLHRIGVQNKVGGLLLLLNTEITTTKQVAEFYGVDQSVIRQIIQRNRQELESNGVKVMRFTEFGEVFKSNNLSLYNVTEYGIGKRGATVFNKRAILLVGFILRDSKIAQEVRNQTLNIIESASDEQKTFEITKERELLMAITFASNEIDTCSLNSA